MLDPPPPPQGVPALAVLLGEGAIDFEGLL